MNFNYLNKIIIFFIFIFIIIKTFVYIQNNFLIINNINEFNDYYFFTSIENLSNIPDIYLFVTNITPFYSKEYNVVAVKFYFGLYNKYKSLIRPSDISLFYKISFLCDIYISEIKDNIYSIPNIEDNKYFFCIEYINFETHFKLGIKTYKINHINEDIDYYEKFFFSENSIKNINNPKFINNNIFNINLLIYNYNQLLFKMNDTKNNDVKEEFKLKSSFIQPPLCFLKKDIAQSEGRWYFNNIYNNYFCFCRGESCINILTFKEYNYQSCKYFFFLTIIDNNRNLYPKEHYLLSDFYSKNIEPADAFPIFKEMIKKKLKAHYMTMSLDIYNKYCLNNRKCHNDLQIIFGVRIINGDILEKFLELFLRLKVVVSADKYDSIDNLFFNIEYITFIFLGHGVTYIKSFLYNDYISHKKYNKVLLPPSDKFINLALDAGWKNEDIIKLGYPKWDNYKIHNNNNIISTNNEKKIEKSIFLMFTWRKVKLGKDISNFYYNNLYDLLNNSKINRFLNKNSIKLFFCFHHEAKAKINIIGNDNLKFINQSDISILLKNSSLIITDFSSILFEAIVQKKPLILYIPDGLDPNIKDLYDKDYYETITKIKKGIIDLYEVFLDLKFVIKKIIYYIKNDFTLEDKKLEFYKTFNLDNINNTEKFIAYIENIK